MERWLELRWLHGQWGFRPEEAASYCSLRCRVVTPSSQDEALAPYSALVTEGKRDPTKACVQDPMFMSRGDRNLGVAFQTHPGGALCSGTGSPALGLCSP